MHGLGLVPAQITILNFGNVILNMYTYSHYTFKARSQKLAQRRADKPLTKTNMILLQAYTYRRAT